MIYKNPLLEKSLYFAARIVKLYQYLSKEKKETIISKQIVRSGTSIGANANVTLTGPKGGTNFTVKNAEITFCS